MEYPEVLEKAQREIDTIVGSDRLPTFEDRPRLPYGEFFGLLAWERDGGHPRFS
jgi:hypothetical protein